MFFRGSRVSTITILFSFLIVNACNTIKPYIAKEHLNWREAAKPEAEVIHTVYLVGDGGAVTDNKAEVMALLKNKLSEESDSSETTVVFLGDNIYQRGLPPESDDDREEKEEILLKQLEAAKHSSRVIFIPGNHDWDYSGPDGLAQLKRQEEFVEDFFNGSNAFVPSNGCPGPVEVRVNDALTIIVVDTEWWLRKLDKPYAPENGCTVEDELDFVIQLEDMIRRNDGRHVLLAAHHPIFSNGNHGGHYNLLDNIFPLRLVRDKLYIPLPVIGSLYPILRKAGASPQDIPNADFQQYKRAILSIIEQRGNVIYAAGHDHNLQLRKYGLMHHIVSGSASKLNFAARGFSATYVHQKKGFCKLIYYKNGEVWAEYYIVQNEDPEGELSFRIALYGLNPEEAEVADREEVPDYRDSVKTIAANENYEISKVGSLFLGSHYRKEWTTPVTVPYIDLKTYRGGLKPVNKGGGKQTITIRFINDDSVQFNLRSVDKFPASAIPDIFRGSWIHDFVKDQTSTAHPYGALTIPKMSKVLELYYTDPELYYTPFTSYLGPYITDFGGKLGFIEIRPDEDLSGYERFGHSENIVSTSTLFDHLHDDNENEVDSKMYLKSRLFDMLIGDWDRHDNQWRWAEYKKSNGGAVFRPVARDRDQVFSLYDGIIPWLLSRKWTFRNFSHFDYEIRDLKGLNYSARNLDRRLLNGLSQEEWLSAAKEIQQQLTDKVIDEAMKQLPGEVYSFSAPEIAAKIKARRNNLITYTREYYKFLAEEVEIVGSEEHEFFDVHRINDEETRVEVYRRKKDGTVEEKIYDRVFFRDETDEIRLFGRDGHDKFVIHGRVDRGIKVRVIGGAEKEDILIDSSYVGKGGKKTIFYDTKTNEPNLHPGKETLVVTSDQAWVNEYHRNSFEYDYFGPRLSLEYNIDDGFYFGGGIKIEQQGFRREPLEISHLLQANYALRTDAVDVLYEGRFYSVFGPLWDIYIDVGSKGPNYVFNYFGQGNNSENKRDINFYRVGMERFAASPVLVRRLSQAMQVGLGPSYESVNIDKDEDNILTASFVDQGMVKSHARFMGFRFHTRLSILDYEVNPERGFSWLNEINFLKELNTGDARFTNYRTDLEVYLTPNLPVKVTFASRLGAATNTGDFYFYHSNFLGNESGLRGFRRNRFAGKTSFYNNNEVRFKVFNIRNSLIKGDFGVVGFFDHGRVWAKNGGAGGMHRSYGPGLYLHFFDAFLISAWYGISDEDKLFTFNAGFLF
ncbi:Surface antigen (D15) precursor [Fulvivirga imtechensis AK7]|uniref:Surface antigen (D15) n=1 Tax=Fulvivirga imtechensis AK7 TaxID=1237149 RepID=L8JKG0_9BACT|nr:BamA/TamA family outer membrane protein [Fulvivirga imtechensis]ELR69260.1 Surface antigen (D15) precursor [Fulvivirga imtechensis AK7]